MACVLFSPLHTIGLLSSFIRLLDSDLQVFLTMNQYQLVFLVCNWIWQFLGRRVQLCCHGNLVRLRSRACCWFGYRKKKTCFYLKFPFRQYGYSRLGRHIPSGAGSDVVDISFFFSLSLFLVFPVKFQIQIWLYTN